MAGRILITGGAGFVGSSLALALRRRPGVGHVVALDNLTRKGSELALPRLAAGDVEFVRGDVRSPEDLERAGPIDLLVECSAEPSVKAGYDGDARYLVETNLFGTAHCLEHVRRHDAGLIFLSTSRVYGVEALRGLPLEREGDRLAVPEGRSGPGWSRAGIARDFATAGARTLYGTTKLCSELLIEEYAAMYGLRAVVDRCGVIAGPWQMGKVDQGFVTLWAARHHFGGPLAYQGFGGEGLQVRDVLHVDDLCDLVCLQARDLDAHRGRLYALGGGPERSTSLRELTALCGELSGRRLEPGAQPETHPSDVPWFVADNAEIAAATGWHPKRSLRETVADIFAWIRAEEGSLREVLS